MMNRREFLRITRKKNKILILDGKRCTGCGLCTIDCPTEALTLSQNFENNSYQILFKRESCSGCGACEKSCPENCIKIVEKEYEDKVSERETKLLFEDEISRCIKCGIPLFPDAMIKKLESKLFFNKELASTFHLCPLCRMKSNDIFMNISIQGRRRRGE
jgi:ferredoxin